MAGVLTFTDLTTLDQAVVQQNHQLLAELVQQLKPDVDAKRGTLYDNLIYLSAVLGTGDQSIADTLVQSSSLLTIANNPSLATPAVVDRVLSNYGITRIPGAKSLGVVQIVLSRPAVITLPRGTVFTANGLTYVTPVPYTSRVSQNAVFAVTDRLVTAIGNGTYGFTIALQAAEVGQDGNAGRGTRFAPATSPSPLFLQAVSLADFTGGVDTETNSAMLGRLSAGLGAKAWSNRMTADALIRSQPAFQGTLGLSIIGYGDPEMVRDQHSVWPGSYGGRVDLYARTQGTCDSVVLRRTATYVASSTSGGVWQFSLARDDVPGFYEIDKITQAGLVNLALTGYAVTSDQRGFDLSGLSTPLPDIASADEAAFSSFSTGTFQFVDTDTPVGGLTLGVSTRTYDIAVKVLPGVGSVQDFLRQRRVGAPAGDVLVKAPIPIFVSMDVTVNVRPGTATLDDEAIALAVSDAVNNLGFGNKLSSGAVVSAVTPFLPPGAVVKSVLMVGSLRREDNSVVQLSASDVLVPPDDPDRPMTSQRTVGYFIKPADVVIETVVVDSPQV